MLKFYGITHPGQRRKDNQDEFICSESSNRKKIILAVIDGVGGYAGGERAALVSKKSIMNYIEEITGEPKRILAEAINHANNTIFEERKSYPEFSKMSCVLSAAIIDIEDSTISFGHVGDTRIYIYRNNEIRKITHDHSIIGYREEIKELTEEEAMNHIQRNEILRVVGDKKHQVDDENFIETGSENLKNKDIVLLCSDGLTDMITSNHINGILNQDISLKKKCNLLIDEANRAGGKDNITVVLAEFTELQNKKAPIEGINIPLAFEESTLPKIELVEHKEKLKSNINTKKTKNFRFIAGLILGIIAGWLSFWAFEKYNNPNKNNLEIDFKKNYLEKELQNRVNKSDTLSWSIDSTTKDSIKLTQSIIISDTLMWAEKGELILEADSLFNGPALVLESKSLVSFKNITFKNFKVGILSKNRNVMLNNIKNENTKVIISWETSKLPYLQNKFQVMLDSLKR